MLQTMASSCIWSMCRPRITSRQPVAVTKMLPRERGLVHGRHLVAFHGRLQGADRVDLGNEHPGAVGSHRMGAALAHVAVAADHHHLAGHHDVGGPLDAVGQRLAAAVEVVELALGDRIVDVDGGHGQLAPLVHLVEAVHAGGGLLGEAANAGQQVAVLRAVDHGRQVAAVVDDQVQRAAVGEDERLLDAPVVLGVGLALPGVDRDAADGHGGRRVVLRRELVATAPLHLGPQLEEASRSAPRSGWSCAGSRRCGRPASGLLGPYFLRRAIRPGISFSASSISFRPQSANDRSATLYGSLVSTCDT